MADVPDERKFEPDVIIIKLRSTNGISPVLSISEIKQKAGAVTSEPVIPRKNKANLRQSNPHYQYDLNSIYRLRLQPGDNLENRINQLRRLEGVEYAEPSYMPRPLLVPNDPDAQGGGAQDYLEVIKAYQAWNVERGDSTVTIAILDTGADFLHEDLINNIQYNKNDPINGLDDDNDGYVDNYRGWDFADDDNDPSADRDHHGTGVCGISASTNNGVGMAGVGFECRFLPLKIFRSEDNSFAHGYEAMVYAAEHGADVINLSWGAPGGFSSFEQDVINHIVEDLNIVVVAAAGNTPLELDFYPASYTNVLSVGASKINDEKAGFATFSNFIDLMAPGDRVYTATNESNYRYAQGSSFSSPMVAGAAALLKARFPELTAAQIMEKLRVNADPIDHLPANTSYKERLGKGRLNIHKALIDQSSPSLRITSFQYNNGRGQYAFFGDTLEISVDLTNYLTPTQNARIVMSTSSPYVTVIDSVFQVGALGTLGKKNNHNTPFRVYLAPDTPVDHLMKFRLGMQDGFYQDYQYLHISTEHEYVTLINDLWSMTISSNGNLGFNEDVYFGGEGLSYRTDFLSGQMGFIHSNADNTVSENIIRDLQSMERQQDFTSLKNIRLTDGSYSDLELKSKFRDLGKNDVHVEQKTLMWKTDPENDLIIFEYRLSNVSGTSISKLSAGMFFDFDLDENRENRADYDPGNNLIYAFNSNTNNYAGLALIKGSNPVPNAIDLGNFNGNTSDIGDSFEKPEKQSFLNTPEQQAGTIGNGNDIAVMMAGSEDNVAQGESVLITFAMVAGNSLQELQDKLEIAKNKYMETLQNPSSLAFFKVCKLEQAVIDPMEGDIYEFYDDKELSNLIFTGSALVTAPMVSDTSFYAINIDSAYNSEVYRVDVGIADPKVKFQMSADTLFLDGANPPVIEFTDQTQSSVSWSWDFSNGFRSNLPAPVIQFQTPGVYPVQLIITNSTGCTDSLTRNLVVAERSPKPDLLDQIICENESVFLDPENSTNIRVYSDPQLGNLIFSGEIFTSSEIGMDTTFYVTSTDSPFESLPEEVNIELDPFSVNFEIVLDTLDLGSRDLIHMVNKSSGNAFNEWTVNGNFINTDEDLSWNLQEDQLIIELTATSFNSCINSKEMVLNAEVSPTPTVNNYELCQPESVRIRPGNGSVFYFYSDEAKNNLVHKGSYYDTDPISTTTSFYVTGMDNFRESPVVEVPIQFTEYTTNFEADKTLVNLLEDNEVHFTYTGTGAVTWLWDFGNGQTSTIQNPSANFEFTGTYNVTLTTSNVKGCSDTKNLELMVEEVLGLDEDTAAGIVLYPNPVQNMLYFSSEFSVDRIRITDIQGRLILEEEKLINNRVDVSCLKQGIYVLDMTIEGRRYLAKFIKQYR